jgi:hypothetical protein
VAVVVGCRTGAVSEGDGRRGNGGGARGGVSKLVEAVEAIIGRDFGLLASIAQCRHHT